MSVLALIWSAVSGGFGKLLDLLRRVPWQAWAALSLLLAAYLWGEHRAGQGYDRGVAHEAPKIVKLTKQRETLLTSLNGLTDATGRMVSSVDAFEASQVERQAAGQNALRKAVEREKRLAGGIAALEAAGRSTGPRVPCPVSKLNKDNLDAL